MTCRWPSQPLSLRSGVLQPRNRPFPQRFNFSLCQGRHERVERHSQRAAEVQSVPDADEFDAQVLEFAQDVDGVSKTAAEPIEPPDGDDINAPFPAFLVNSDRALTFARKVSALSRHSYLFDSM